MHTPLRGASPIPFVVFLLLWLVSCYVAHRCSAGRERSRERLARKKISALQPGQTVPGLETEQARLRLQIRRVKTVLGYAPEGRPAGSVPVDSVLASARATLNRYHDDAIPRGPDGPVTISAGGAEKVVEIMIDGASVSLPIIGQRHDLLTTAPRVLNLERVVSVLRRLTQILHLHREQLRRQILVLQTRQRSIEAGSRARQMLVEVAIRRNEQALARHAEEAAEIKARLVAQLATARDERRELDRVIQSVDRKIQRVKQAGATEIQTLQNLIKQANKIRTAGIARGSRPAHRRPTRRYRTREALLAGTVLTDPPDGEVIASSADAVWIDLGRRDRVVPGMMFFVYSHAAGDDWAYRAKIQVLRVQESIARCRMIHVKDRFAPATAGDKLFNKPYRTPREITLRNEPQRVAFIGRFPRSGAKLPLIKNMLRRLGVRIDERLTHWTTLVVVEEDYERAPDFIRATQDLNIEVLTVAQLREFLAY